MAKKLPGKQVGVGLLLALISVGIALFFLEIGTRFLSAPYEANTGQIYACHPTLGWTGAPNFRGMLEHPNFRQQLAFNSLGMHDTEHPLTKAADTYRILMLGDSFVQAVQVSEEQSSHQLLENKLNELEDDNSRRFEVLSGGVVNWGTNQQLQYYREQGRQFQPDLVLLALYIGNDLSDNLPGNMVTVNGFNCYAPYFSVCQGSLDPQPLLYAPGLSQLRHNCSTFRRVLINGLGRLFQYSRLYQQLEPLIVTTNPRQQFGQAYPSAFSALYLPTDEDELKQAWLITEALLIQLQQEVEADGAHLAVALISPEIVVRLGALSAAEQELFLRDNPALAEAEIDRPNRRLAEFLDAQNIPYVDLTAPLSERLAATRSPLYILGEGHWTVEGNRVAANILTQWFVDSQLVPLDIKP
jgi:hypothetical protein